jgi:hypothetical protein
MFYGQCWKCGERWAFGTASTCKCLDETPNREWVGLTDKEIEKCWKAAMKLNNGKGADITNQPFYHLVKITEKILMEKNNG